MQYIEHSRMPSSRLRNSLLPTLKRERCICHGGPCVSPPLPTLRDPELEASWPCISLYFDCMHI